jgi:flagellar motor switch protein FliN/FliY
MGAKLPLTNEVNIMPDHASPPNPDSQPRPVEGRPLDLPDLSSQSGSSQAGPRFDPVQAGDRLDPLMKIPLEVRVVLGTARRKLADLAAIEAGSLLELDSIAGEPVLLTVAGIPFAKAEVVVIDDQYAVRISELLEDLAVMVDAVHEQVGGRR